MIFILIGICLVGWVILTHVDNSDARDARDARVEQVQTIEDRYREVHQRRFDNMNRRMGGVDYMVMNYNLNEWSIRQRLVYRKRDAVYSHLVQWYDYQTTYKK